MNTRKQDIPQLVIDQVTTARGEATWSKMDIETLKAASLLKVKHNYKSCNRKLTEDKRTATEESAYDFKAANVLLKKMRQEEENIAFEMMKGSSAIEAFKSCLSEEEFELWQFMTPQNKCARDG